MSEKKICIKCGEEKIITDFPFRIDRQKYRNECKFCLSSSKKEYRAYHKNDIRQIKQKYYNDNKPIIKEKSKKYRDKNKENISKKGKKYYEKNKEVLLKKSKSYQEENKESISLQKKEYYQQNKENIIAYQNDRQNKKRKEDQSFRLRKDISRAVAMALKNKNASKNGDSFLIYAGWTIEELRQNIESKFESWMTWDNRRQYNALTWDDNDQSTWVWNLDHIIPQSDLPYNSMEHPNFKKCWALENLRPYSAKQNIIDGSSKIRHKSKETSK